MKRIKVLSRVLVLTICLSGATPLIAQPVQPPSKDHSSTMKKRFEEIQKKLKEYIKCFATEKGCSRARYLAIGAALVAFFYLVGRHERTEWVGKRPQEVEEMIKKYQIRPEGSELGKEEL